MSYLRKGKKLETMFQVSSFQFLRLFGGWWSVLRCFGVLLFLLLLEPVLQLIDTSVHTFGCSVDDETADQQASRGDLQRIGFGHNVRVVRDHIVDHLTDADEGADTDDRLSDRERVHLSPKLELTFHYRASFTRDYSSITTSPAPS